MKRKWDVSSELTRKKCIEEIIARVEEQAGAQFGVLAASDVIDIVLQNLGPDIYNLALKDVRKLVQEKIEDIEVGLDLLNNAG